MSELPNGWAVERLGSIAEINPPQPTVSIGDQDVVSFIPMAKVQAESGLIDSPDLRAWGEVKKGYTKFQDGDLLFAKITPCMENGKVAIAKELSGGIGAGSTEFHVIRPPQGLRAEYLFYYLVQRDVRRNARMEMKGAAGQLRVPPSFLEKLELPFAPACEQDRIVAEIEKQFTRLDAATAALKRVQANLKRYRASVLKAACEGRLVATEAELARKEGRAYEPASELLQRILRERRTRWESDTLAKLTASGKPPKDDRWKDKYKEPSAPDTSNLPTLPEGWCWASLDQLFNVERGRFSFRPRNDPRFYEGSHPFVQIGDLPREGGSIREFSQTLNEQGLSISKMFESGTVLIAIVGATIGNTGVLTFNACCPDSIVAIQGNDSTMLAFVEYFLRLRKLELRNVSYASGGQPNINLALLCPYPVPIAPRAEVRRIVEELDCAFSSIEKLEPQIQGELGRADALRRSTLKSAFCGQLVPQDSADEPASALLERIRAEREATEKGKPARRRLKELAHA